MPEKFLPLRTRTAVVPADTCGDIERRVAAHPTEGYSFASCNWKKRKAKFIAASGALRFVSF